MKKPILLTREQACEMLGNRPADLTRLIKRGDLRTATAYGAKGTRPVEKIYEEDILFLIQHAKKTAADAPSPSFADRYTPEDASRMFAALKSDTSVEDCIISLKIHPRAALAIKQAWDEVRGAVTLSREGLARVEKMGLEGTFPITTSEELMEVLENAGQERACSTCRKRPASMCRSCSTTNGSQPGAGSVASVNGHSGGQPP